MTKDVNMMEPDMTDAVARACDGVKIDKGVWCATCGNEWDGKDAPPCQKDLSSPEPVSIPKFLEKPGVLSILEDAAATFKDRNAVYGGNYQRMGELLIALFPPGGFVVTSVEQANRLNLMIDCLGKLQRYAYAFERGGHQDSAHDLIVYAAMLEEATK